MIHNVVIIGAGTMGHGIAEICALAKYNVTLIDVDMQILDKAMKKIRWSLVKLQRTGKINEKVDAILERINTTTELNNAVKQADLIIEVVPEIEQLKIDLFKKLDNSAPKNCILATNTSSIPISAIANALISKKSHLLGLHFFNPPTLIKLVELVFSEYTDAHVLEIIQQFVQSLNMDYITVKKDIPGFIVNRINLRIFSEALRLLELGYTPIEIDTVARYRLKLPMGFFELMDFVGLDVLDNVIESLKRHNFNIPRSKILKSYISEGKLGVKTDVGFYKYKKPYTRITLPRKDLYKVDALALLAPGINEATWLIAQNIATPTEIDKGMVTGMGYPKGLLIYADEYGLDMVVEKLQEHNYVPEQLLLKMIRSGNLGIKTGMGFYKWQYKKLTFSTVLYEKRYNYAYIVINRPEKRNALTKQTWMELTKAINKAELDNDIKSIVITGADDAFCAGDDIHVMESWQQAEDVIDFFAKAKEFVHTMVNTTKPTIAAVNGVAYGGGAEMLMLFDMVFVVNTATLSLPELSIGAIPPIATTLGVFNYGRKLLNYIFTGDPIPLSVALDLGLIDEIVPKTQLSEIITEYVTAIATKPLNVIKAAKRAINTIKSQQFNNIEKGLNELISIALTPNFKEGMKAFIEKRAPRWH